MGSRRRSRVRFWPLAVVMGLLLCLPAAAGPGGPAIIDGSIINGWLAVVTGGCTISSFTITVTERNCDNSGQPVQWDTGADDGGGDDQTASDGIIEYYAGHACTGIGVCRKICVSSTVTCTDGSSSSASWMLDRSDCDHPQCYTQPCP